MGEFMALYINSTKNGSTAYNVHNSVSTKLNKMKINNTLVWQGLPEWYTAVRDNNIVTESQWLDFLNNNGIIYAKNRNEQNLFIGTDKKITIANSQTPDYSYWNIADFDHDGTSNTCDLMQCNAAYKSAFSNSSQNNTAYYSNSTIRIWLLGTYYNGFSSDVRNKLITMDVSSESATLNDKVKLLSVKEVGGSNTYAPAEGSKYPIFTSTSGTGSDDSRKRSGAENRWWLRTRYTYESGYDWNVSANGSLYSSIHSYTALGIVPCIRFS